MGTSLGTSAFDGSVAAAIDTEGHIVVSGFTLGSFGGPQQGEGDAFVAKYGPGGKLDVGASDRLAGL